MLIAVFRVDANHRIGTGHLKRCIVLADALKGKAEKIVFLLKTTPLDVQKEIQRLGFKVLNLPDTVDEADSTYASLSKYNGNKIVFITDGDNEEYYHSKYQLALINYGFYLVIIPEFNS